MFLPPEEFSWVCKCHVVLAPQLFWESSVIFSEQDDRIME